MQRDQRSLKKGILSTGCLITGQSMPAAPGKPLMGGACGWAGCLKRLQGAMKLAHRDPYLLRPW